MGRTWILHTETKGTGAQMVPLETITSKSSSSTAPVFVPPAPTRPSEPETPRARTAHEFRVVDVVTRQILADRAVAREAIEALREIRSPVDVNVYVWRPEQDRWRLLTIGEKRALWELRDA